MNTVSIAELRAAADQIFDHLVAENGPDVALQHDYFWSVPQGEIFDMTQQPSALTVGQVSESIEFLRSAAGKDRLAYELRVARGCAEGCRHAGREVDEACRCAARSSNPRRRRKMG